jgi:hypothetical protein
MSGDDQQAKSEFRSDEDWKNRVKAEDAARDQQFRHPNEAAAPAGENAEQAEPEPLTSSDDTIPPELPSPTFGSLLGMLSTEAMVALGIIPHPMTQKAELQLPMARYLIDLLALLEQKTVGNLTKEESTTLDETLHSLRMTFIQRSKVQEPARS